jgi:hypothetical protein
LKDWKMKPMVRFRICDISLSERRLTSLPSSRYVPESNVSSRPATFRNVVLPEPEGPVTETNSPAFTESERSSRACVSIDSVR